MFYLLSYRSLLFGTGLSQRLQKIGHQLNRIGVCMFVWCLSGASGDHVFVHMYPGHNEDFAGSDPSQLDTWVFDQVKVRYKLMSLSSLVICINCTAF